LPNIHGNSSERGYSLQTEKVSLMKIVAGDDAEFVLKRLIVSL
jgi:hypothetical protein